MLLSTASDYRHFYQDVSGELNVTATTDDTELVTVRDTKHTLFIQRIIFYVTTDAAQTMGFQDDNTTPKKVAEIPSSPGDESRWDFDYGEEGIPLTEGKNFEMAVSAVGLAGQLKWYGYQKLTGVGAP
jgi:hypothetical protein